MKFLDIFKPRRKASERYAPIKWILDDCQRRLHQSLAQKTCIQDGVMDFPISAWYLAFEISAYLFAKLTRLMQSYDHAVFAQQDLEREISLMVEAQYRGVITRPASLFASRVRQHNECAKLKYGRYISRLRLIQSVVAYQHTKRTWNDPKCFLENLTDKETADLLVSTWASLGKRSFEEESDESVQTMRLLEDLDGIWLGESVFGSIMTDLFKNCTNIAAISDEELTLLLKARGKAPSPGDLINA